MLEAPEDPARRSTFDGRGEIWKSTALIITVAALDTWPLVPVTVTVYEPKATVDFTKTVMVDVPDPSTARVSPDGARDEPRPAGAVAVRFTLPAKPPILVTLTVKVPEEAKRTFEEAGAIKIVKPGPCLTLTEILTECESDPLVPITVRV